MQRELIVLPCLGNMSLQDHQALIGSQAWRAWRASNSAVVKEALSIQIAGLQN